MKTLLFVAFATTAAAQPVFEAASIKAVPPGPCPQCWQGKGGPGTGDPGRVMRSTTLKGLILEAYDLAPYQFYGPDWLEDQRFEFTATMQPGTTREQYHQMFRAFLADRFQITLHRETRQLPVLKLIVAKGGSKLRTPAPDPSVSDDDARSGDGPGKLERDAEGYPILRNGTSMAITSGPDGKSRARAQGRNENLERLVTMLKGQTNMPVIDATGLTGKFDYLLSWIPTPPGAPPSDAISDLGPDLYQALTQQLGLKLETGKGPVECLIIDSANRMPAAN